NSGSRRLASELGTYYLIDLQQYEQSQQLAAAHVALAPGEDVTDRLTVALQTLHAAISIAGSITVVLIVIGSLCVLSGRLINGAVVYCSAFWTGIVWVVQRQLIRKILLPPNTQ
ncbi:MAG: hypothetical protein AAFR99_22765, partial [Cyanobacteria bacterium J06629_9]